MREINILDLAYIAGIKSELLASIAQLESPNQCTKEEVAGDLRRTVITLMELEDTMQDSFSDEAPRETKNRPNSAFLAGRS